MTGKVKCLHCGSETVPRKKNVMNDDFSHSEQWLCMFCGKELTMPELAAETPAADDENMAKLNSLLGEKLPDKSIKGFAEAEIGNAERRFCRDCAEYVAHPFLSRCNKKQINVCPMDDCAEFVLRKMNDGDKQDGK